MQLLRDASHIVIRLEKGEEITAVLARVAEQERINGAFFYGLGAIKDCTLGYFDAAHKEYLKKQFRGEYEITALVGNIARLNGKVVVHCHVSVAGRELDGHGGHLFEGWVAATCEIILTPVLPGFVRRFDQDTGLNLLDL